MKRQEQFKIHKEIHSWMAGYVSESTSGDTYYVFRPQGLSDVVKDIIGANDYKKQSVAKAEEVKRILRNYNGMTSRLRQDLIDLGFVITEDGKHYKITYYGDGRYHTVFAKTPSDDRSGKNNAQTVIRICF